MDEIIVREPQLSDEYLIAIGRVIVNWSQLDSVFDLLLIKLQGCRLQDSRPFMVIAGMSFGPKLEIAKALLNADACPLDAHLRDRIVDNILPRISAMQAKRNAVAHYRWLADEDGVRGIRISAKGKLKIVDDIRPIEELRSTSAEMVTLMNEIFRMIPLDEFFQIMST